MPLAVTRRPLAGLHGNRRKTLCRDIEWVTGTQSDLVEVVHTLRQAVCVKGRASAHPFFARRCARRPSIGSSAPGVEPVTSVLDR